MRKSVTRRATSVEYQSLAQTVKMAPAAMGEGHQDKERVLDEAYEKYCRLRDAGESVNASLFCDQYPAYRKSLRKLIDVHEVFDQVDCDEDVWPESNSVFLGFVVHHQLGIGAIARVYLASELALGRRLVALKVSQFGSDEAETLGKLIHANVVPVHSVNTDLETGMTAVCMPYLGSSTLADVLEEVHRDQQPGQARQILAATRRREMLPESLGEHVWAEAPDKTLLRGSYVDGVIHLARQLAEALDYTHGQGVLHRDLKPSNVLVTPSGRPMLLDFNLSCDETANINRMGGTLPYMAPEQIREAFDQPGCVEGSADARSDIFSLGVILYEMLTGKLPFGDPPNDPNPRSAAAAYLNAQQTPPLPTEELNPQVSRQMGQLVESCLSPETERRPQAARQLADHLHRHFTPQARCARFLYRYRLAGGIAAAVTILALGIGTAHLLTRAPYEVRQFRQGVECLAHGDHQAALLYLNRVGTANRETAEVAFARGIALLRLEHYEPAAQHLYKAAEQLQTALAYECAAYAMYMSGNRTAAASLYRAASRVEPRQVHLYLLQARCYVDSVQPGAAERAIDRLLEIDDTVQAGYVLRAKALLRMIERTTNNQRIEPLLEKMLADIDQAVALGHQQRSLLLHACQRYAYAVRIRPELLPRLQDLVASAVGARCSRASLEAIGPLAKFKHDYWFRELVAHCGPAAPQVAPYDVPVTPPADSAIDSALAQLVL